MIQLIFCLNIGVASFGRFGFDMIWLRLQFLSKCAFTFRDELAAVKCLLSTKGKVVCGVRTCPAPLPQVPPGSAQSAVMLALEANNMWAKQVAAVLDAQPDIQPAHDSTDEEDHSSPPPKEQCTSFGEV